MNFEQSLKNYFSIIQTKIDLNDGIKKMYGKTLAPAFNSFDFWSIDENKVSEIIAFFLDPNGTHSQGNTFLKIFLNKINKQELNKYNNAVKVQCEYSTNENRRIDIAIIFGDNDFIIGIENKIYENTPDQNEQIQHYSDYLKQISSNNYLLIYLAPEKKQLSDISISEEVKVQLTEDEKLIQLSYENDIIDCIHTFSLLSESERVRSFLLDFEKKLKQMYIGENFMNDNEMILNYALQSNENLNLTLKIGNAVNVLKNNLYQKFEDQLSEIGEELKIKIEKQRFTPNDWNDYNISFSFESHGLIYGITRNEFDKGKTRNEEIEEVLGGKWKVSNWWICWRFLYSNFESNPENFIRIENGEMKIEIKQIVEDFISKLKSFKM